MTNGKQVLHEYLQSYYTCPHKNKLNLNESILLSLAILMSIGVAPLSSKQMTTFYLKETELYKEYIKIATL